jgi:siroheme synthase-like protein
MRTHPVFLRLEGRRCVIVGADDMAAAKARACLAAGATVTIVAERIPPDLAARSDVRHVARAYRSGDLAGAVLAYATTRDPSLIERLVNEAERERVLLNVVDVPEACAFFAPAVAERGDLKIAVGTGGASPGLAARLRTELAAHVGPEYAPFVAILGAVRRALGSDPARGEVVTTLAGSALLELVRDGRVTEIDALLARVAGEGYTLDRLGVRLGSDA